MTKNSNWRPVALALTTLGALARLLPHPPNFAPVGSMSLFAGARLPVWQAYLIPIALMAITDPILGAFYGVPAYSKGTIFFYSSFLISVWLGRRLRGTENVPKIAAFALVNSMQFFLVSNFAVWQFMSTYPHNSSGLLSCYVGAIPLFWNTLAGDAFYAALLFGAYALAERLFLAPEEASQS